MIRTLSRSIVLLLGLTLSVVGRGQAQPQPGGSASKVDWTVQGDTLAPGDTGRLTLRATIADGWKMYAPDSPPPTRGVAVRVDSAPGREVSTEKLEYADSKAAYDPNFGKTVQFYEGDTWLAVPVRVMPEVSPGSLPVEGTLAFMVCTDELCLPPTTTSFSATLHLPEDGDE